MEEHAFPTTAPGETPVFSPDVAVPLADNGIDLKRAGDAFFEAGGATGWVFVIEAESVDEVIWLVAGTAVRAGEGSHWDQADSCDQ